MAILTEIRSPIVISSKEPITCKLKSNGKRLNQQVIHFQWLGIIAFSHIAVLGNKFREPVIVKEIVSSLSTKKSGSKKWKVSE